MHRFGELDNAHRSSFEKLGLMCIQQTKQFKELNTSAQRALKLLSERNKRQDEGLVQATGLLEEIRRTTADLVEQDVWKCVHRARRVELAILDSLRFEDMTHRFESIGPTHASTYEWIFRDPTLHQKPWSNFSQWLRCDSGLYWVQGKPASGKSTLMRYIWNHPNMKGLLYGWKGHNDLLLGNFYFWSGGSQNQRSHAGLLRTLLYEALYAKKDLVLKVFKEEWERKRDLEFHDLRAKPDDWSLGRLQHALKDLVALASPRLRICFFIDGLDEYEGDPGDMAEFVYDLATSSKYVKFCVSGRPLSAFQSLFHSTPGLKLQDLTVDDITLYVDDKLTKNRHMRDLLRTCPQDGQWLIDEIATRASGVFLWVVLVVKSLVNGFRSGETISHLYQRLEKLPVDLENLFAHILAQIEPELREESSRIFRIFKANGNVLSAIDLYYILMSSNYQDSINMRTNTMEEIDSRNLEEYEALIIQRMKLRLSSRCRGLLEIVEPEVPVTESGLAAPEPKAFEPLCERKRDANPGHNTLTSQFRLNEQGDLLTRQHQIAREPRNLSKLFVLRQPRDNRYFIVYLHKTLSDFLKQPKTWDSILDATRNTDFNPRMALLMGVVNEAKMTPLRNVFETGMGRLREIIGFQLAPETPMVQLIEELDRVYDMRWKEQGHRPHWSRGDPIWVAGRPDWADDLDSAAVQAGLLSLVKARRDLASAANRAQMEGLPLPFLFGKRRPGLPLLLYAVSFQTWARNKSWNYDLEVVRNLLASGCDPNEIFQGYTVWQYVIHHIHSTSYQMSIDQAMQRVEIMTLFLMHGADPHACCIEDSRRFDQATGLLTATNSELVERSYCHEWESQVIGTKRGFDEATWDANHIHPYLHSVTAVVEDIFKKRSKTVPAVRGLFNLLQKQKKRKARTIPMNKTPTSKGSGPPRPDWVS